MAADVQQVMTVSERRPMSITQSAQHGIVRPACHAGRAVADRLQRGERADAGLCPQDARSLRPSTAGDAGTSVRVVGVNRELDQYLQSQLRIETSGGAYADLRSQFYSRLQAIYGDPSSDSSLESVFNNFTGSVQSLVTSPDSTAARSLVLSNAQVLAQTLNTATADIQTLRTDAESGLADAVATANDAMQQDRRSQHAARRQGHHQRLRCGARGPARQLCRSAVAVDGHPGRHRTTRTRSASSPIPASSWSARRPSQLAFNAQGTVVRDDAVECRSDQEQPRHAVARVAERERRST